MHEHDAWSVLTLVTQHLHTAEGWRLAAAALASEVGDGRAFFFLEGEAGTSLETSDADEAEAFAHFLAAPASIPFHRIESPAGEPVAAVLKRIWRDGRSAGLVIRAQGATVLEEAATQYVAGVAPLVELALGTSFAIADIQDRLMLDVLDTLGLPAATIDRGGVVVALNRGAASSGPLWKADVEHPFRFREKRAQIGFERLLAEQAPSLRSLLLRSNGGGEAPQSLHLLPLGSDGRAGFPRSNRLVIASPAEAPSAEMIRSAFGLSPVEAQLTRGILTGRAIEEIATSTSRSAHTVRNQLKGVLAKSGAHSQTQLAGLVGRLLPFRGLQ